MSTEKDVTRIVRSWLEDGADALPDRVLDRVLDELPATPQRRAPWQAWRLNTMSSPIKITLAAAAVGLFALGGITLLPRHDGGPANAGASPASSPPAAASATGTILFQRADGDNAPLTVYAIAADGTGQRTLLPSGSGLGQVSPDDKRISYFSIAADGNFTGGGVANIDGSGQQAMPAPDANLKLGPQAWLNSNTVVFSAWDDTDPSRNGMFVADPSDMKTLKRLTTNPNGGNDAALAVSSSGDRIAFVSTKAGTDEGDLYVIDADGSHSVKLNPAGTFVSGSGPTASWSPDGKQVAFVAGSGGGQLPKVYVVDANGGTPTVLFHSGGPIWDTQWSPDGKLIVFENPFNTVSGGDGHLQLVTVRPDGTDLVTITSSEDRSILSWGPRWSPDGARLVFLRQDAGLDWNKADLWTANVDGSELTQLTHSPGLYEAYTWVP